MDIQALRYAVTLAEELHFGRAAKRHFISAQPFGQAVQRLEREVGIRLFERTSRRVSLTSPGARFVARARVVLAELDGLRQIAAEEAGPATGSLRVGILGFGAADRWQALRDALDVQRPGLSLRYRDAAGLIGADQVHVHCNTLTEPEWQILARNGAKVSISVETELNMGMGRPAFTACQRHGIAPTLSCDIISLNTGDLFSQLRQGLGFKRWADTEAINLAGGDPDRVSTTALEALRWSTVNAAEALGLGDRIGSLTPGKQADLMIVGGPGTSQHPVIDAAGTLIFQTTASDVRTVLVAGRVVKQDGVLTGVDLPRLLNQAETSAEEILARVHAAVPVLPPVPPGGFAVIRDLSSANLSA